jgi:regulatory protein
VPAPRVTGHREARRGQVAVDLDGSPWRVLPVDVVVRTHLVIGAELDRPRARELARELRRVKALGAAARALRYRDLTAEELRRRLERRGIRPSDRREALAALERAGVVDDVRYARSRAERLAERYGDLAVRDDLERHGVAPELAAAAVAALEPEGERACRLAARRGANLRTARELLRRGFGEEAIAAAVPVLVANEG